VSLDSLEAYPRQTEGLGLGSLGRASLVYSLGGLAYKGVALITIPILARLLSPAQLGVLDLAAVLASTVGLLAVLGTDQAVAFHEPRSPTPATLWSSALTVVLLAGALLAMVGLVLRDPIAKLLTGDPSNGWVIAAAGFYGLVLAVGTTALNAVRLRGTPGAYAIASFVIAAAEVSLALAAAWLFPGTVTLMVFGWAVGALAITPLLLRRYLPGSRSPSVAAMRALVSFGAPLVPAAVAWLIGDAWIRGVLAREVELVALGEYGIAYRIASVLGLVVTGFGIAWYPFLYRSAEEQVAPRASRALSLVLLAFAAIGVALTAFSPEIIAIVAGDAYADARHAIGPLVGGMVALGGFVLVGAVVGASGSTRPIAVTAIVGAAAQVVASTLLVPPLGLVGAGLASLIGYLTAAVLLVLTEARLLGGREGIVIAGTVAVAAASVVLGSAVTDAPIAVRTLSVVAIAAVSLLVALAIVRVGGQSDPLA
jgi:O-antigen/teichoic acid export membrane protein